MKNKIDFEELKNPKKEIYESLWKNCDLDFEVAKKGIKDPSYEIAFSDKTLIDFVGDKIALSFDINKNKDTFAKKFQMACSGTGDELKKITTLHSSSLCALLFFFNVDNKKLVIPSLSEYEFTESYLEFQNKVIRSPSNIDVVLLGKNIKTGKKVILFLESKFSEYITGIGKKKVSQSYFKSGSPSFPIYDFIANNNIFNFNKEKGFCDSEKYNEGLKQMISHYYGIRNFMEKNFAADNEDIYKNIREYGADEIILGEILFDNFAKNSGLTEKLNNYKSEYSKLADIINEQYDIDKTKPENIKFKVLTESLVYSDLQKYISDFPKIKKFYFGNK